jgi:hypothetical protein
MGAESRLSKKCCHKFVPVELVNAPSHSTATTVEAQLSLLEFLGLLIRDLF